MSISLRLSCNRRWLSMDEIVLNIFKLSGSKRALLKLALGCQQKIFIEIRKLVNLFLED